MLNQLLNTASEVFAELIKIVRDRVTARLIRDF